MYFLVALMVFHIFAPITIILIRCKTTTIHMKRSRTIFLSILSAMLIMSANVLAQVMPIADQQLYDFFQNIPIDYSVGAKSAKHNAPDGAARSGSLRDKRPDHVNNQATNFFPPIFNQSGGSCGSSANVAYMLCYEINSLRNQDGKHNTDYQFPSHFTWLTCSNSCPESTMAERNGIPSVTTYGGQTYSRYFGLQDTEEKDAGWMQGYDKWYSAMFNRAKSMGKFQYGLDTPEGIELAKDWLWNHCGDEEFQSGGVFVIGVAAGPEFTLFPNTAANQAAGVMGHHYVTTWGPQYNHALTVVGYDDRVEFDLDSNGVIGEKEKGETGAWIIANSWGTGWCDQGTIYCPYAYTYCVGLSGAAWDPAFYHPRKNYRPLRTIKLLMDHSRRPEICLNAGVAQDTSATEPEFSTSFAHFNYTGSLKTGSSDIPMLGRWADGYHFEPMELGYDLTDLTANVDRTKPIKYFFYITTKYSASGKGNVYKASIMDYEFDREGIEIPFHIDTVAILNRGKTTMISVIIPGEQTYKPINLQLNHGTLSWEAPQKSNLRLAGYKIYNNGAEIATVDAKNLTYNIQGTASGSYTVAAAYEYCGQENLSDMSNSVRETLTVPNKANTVLELRNSAIIIPEGVPAQMQDATIEFWLYPYSLTSYNQQIGRDWGTFLFHTTGGGNIYVGWNTGSDRITSASGLLTANTWTHVAITIKNNVMTLYVNGEKKNTLTSTSYSGLPAISSFMIGDGHYKFNARIDEFRIWSSCRTPEEIQANMHSHISNPGSQPDLVTYLNMDRIESDGIAFLPEYGSGHNVDITGAPGCDVITDESFLSGSKTKLAANFTLSAESIVKGENVVANPSVTTNATKIEWTAEGSQSPTTNLPRPALTYSKAGTYNITLKAYDTAGNTAECTKTLTITEPPVPVADFDIAIDNIPAGDRVSLVNRSTGGSCTYLWSMPGAETETAIGTNASALYLETGRHPVTLTATNASGSHSVTKYVTIRNTLPAVSFDVNPATVIVGQKVGLVDKTKYEPTKWMWAITNERHNIGINGQNYAFEPKYPGVYDVSLTATNDIGTATASQRKAIFVSNADPQNGLNFAGSGEQVSFKSPVNATTKSFTIDYWLYPYTVAGAANLTNDDGIINLTTAANGETTLALNGKSVTSSEGYVVAGEWHHYAIVYKSGTVIFYRDGEKFLQPTGRLALSSPAWKGNMTLGSKETPFNGMIDEFCFWNKSLTLDEIQQTCNAPLPNPDSLKQAANLVVYYDFNQSSGHVNSATGDEYLGTRIGFGPDGDAWTSSLGVFTLDFSERAVEKDITSDYLTNTKAPFRHTENRVNTTNYISRFYELEQETTQSSWIVENTTTTGNITTGVYVDTYYNSDLTCTTGDLGFGNTINDQRTYQTITLPAGRYRLTVKPHATAFSESGSYIAVCEGDTLVGNTALHNAIAYAQLNDKQLEFDITEDNMTISLGFIFNLTNIRTIAIEQITLTQIPYEYINAEDPDGLAEAPSSATAPAFTIEPGGVRCTGSGEVHITTLHGINLRTGLCAPGALIRLPQGVYIINNQKVEIK